ncbi:MAG: hypothetical protein KC493_06600 [Bacteriovoracaceae bacterium]|nr:hypothetical protein [Bacteriovoracaceae bacterium]
MKFLTSIMSVTMLLLSFSAMAENGKKNIDPALKKQIAKEFSSFRKENLQMREKHQDELYKLQLKVLKENHERAKSFFKELSGIEDDIEFGNKSENKKVQKKLKVKREAFKNKMKAERKKIKETMQAKRKNFKEKMQNRRKDFKRKIKSMKKS